MKRHDPNEYIFNVVQCSEVTGKQKSCCVKSYQLDLFDMSVQIKAFNTWMHRMKFVIDSDI